MTATWVAPVDLDNCAAEPIHVPGAIQPHGSLVAVTEPDLTIVVVSANVADAERVIGRDLGALIGAENRQAIDAARQADWVQRRDGVALAHDGRQLTATLHRSDGHLVIEIEDRDDGDGNAASVVREAAMALQASTKVFDVAAHAARWVRSLTGFDRVMVYRFDADWNGEVIAEVKRDDLNAFIGLHYPSTDIPAQAREMYRRNWLRLIPDIHYEPVPLVPPVAYDSARPLDMSTSTLRSVSPIHVEYLANMGVSASMSVSIVIQGELWGLIACHHYSGPHRPGVAARNAAEYLAQLISMRIAETEEADIRSRTFELVALADKVAEELAQLGAPDIDDVLRNHEADVLGLAGATGAVVVTETSWRRLGAVPSDQLIERLIAAWPGDAPVLRIDRIADPSEAAVAGGVMALPLSPDRRELVMWFRPELVRQVDWGGDPHNAKLGAEEGADVRLSPRRSFARWRETVRGRSAPWQESEVRAATRFSRHLMAGLLRQQRGSAELARDLQRVMRPDSLPVVEGWCLAVHDEPAGRGQIGGDWFDVFEAADGVVVAVVGDVAGHGLTAAAEMAQLRNSLRAYLLDDPSPSGALERLDRLMARALRGTIATAVCAVIDTRTSEARIAHAGHVPALVVRSEGATLLESGGDPLLGFSTSPRQEQRLTLGPGDALVLYSDGLVEQRRRPIDVGLALLCAEAHAVVADSERDAVDIAERLAGRLHDDDDEDDTSVLVIRRCP
ncbi:MAG: SpoIIE family protein phosphatase [Ilumatobacteraceae bacterium]